MSDFRGVSRARTGICLDAGTNEGLLGVLALTRVNGFSGSFS